jgi:Transposase and inactivated derivatives
MSQVDLIPTFCHNNRVPQIQAGKDPLEGRWYSVNEVASHLGVAIDTIYRWIERKNPSRMMRPFRSRTSFTPV